MKFSLVALLLITSLAFSACHRKAADGADNANTPAESELNAGGEGNRNAAILPADANQPALGEKTAISPDCYDKTMAQPSMKCDDDKRPVCGCNGKTYKNACEADKAGVLLYKWGPCSKTAKTAVQ